METKDFSKFKINVKVLSTEKREDFPELPPELNRNLFNFLDNLDNVEKNKPKIEEHLNSLDTGFKYYVKHLGEDYNGVIYSNFEITRKEIA